MPSFLGYPRGARLITTTGLLAPHLNSIISIQIPEASFEAFNKTTPHRSSASSKMPPKKKVERGPQENVSLGPQVREGELVFGVARIFAR